MSVHLGLCLLVMVNLLFVHITGVVDTAWMLAFGALTLSAPVFRRFAERLPYRIAWNGVVLLLFASLVQRTLDQGVGRMLEGGLVLAAFCQVHLVNNVSARQRPDLLLFNSFLIAVITAFFCQELSYCAVFVAYTFALLMVWRLLTHRDGRGTMSLAMVLGDGIRQATCVLLGTIAMFLLWPRDFEREGLVGERFMQAAQAQVGIADEIHLSHKLSPVLSDKVAMKIHARGEIPTHWRGTTFRLLQLGAWHATDTAQDADRSAPIPRERSLDVPWREQGQGKWARPAPRDGAALRVELFDAANNRLFLPLAATSLHLLADAASVPHFPLVDGTFGYFAEAADTLGTLTYAVECAPAASQQRTASPGRLDGWLALDPSAVPIEALTMAQEVRAALPAMASAEQVAQAMCARLRADFSYGLPGHAGSASNFVEFFRVRRGHCEFFASALAMMLRSQRIACRLVGGFLAVEREDEDTVVVRARHAHAWVEVWDRARGWCTLDPTPASTDGLPSDSWLGRLLEQAESAWTAVTGFDERRRTQAMQWLGGLPGHLAASARAHPWGAALIVALLALLWHRRRTRGVPPVVEYERAVRRTRLRLRPGETPRQLLARARGADLPAAVLQALTAATERHERLRYRCAAPLLSAAEPKPTRGEVSQSAALPRVMSRKP